MKLLFRIIFGICFSFLIFDCGAQEKTDSVITSRYFIVVHGGAGNMTPNNLPDSLLYKEKLTEALKKASDTLAKGGTSLDAVEVAIHVLEDSPLFNAGKGAVFNDEGKNELDASIMDGKTLKAGAVAGVTTVRNPISAARAVMEKSKHVMLIGKGAEMFAKEQGLEIVDPSYFFDQKRWNLYLKLKGKSDIKTTGADTAHGTVGVVALDKYGNLAAGTSTGGLSNKKYGRIGDSPIIGAGTYANNKTCAVSCTGTGEYFIRNVVAYDMSALMEYKGYTIQQAADHIIHEKLQSQGGDGGLIALDKNGNYTMTFNTEGMFRGYADSSGEVKVLLFK
ncbi:MAG TPA: isoaspartyl peptidase/L-asparaginase [Bacteroidales bacterium]|nr:isoaspartyl peptidase/L-asparaginase [Bacteroidales bacterium]HPS15682.1 isoaspartyl peptidase/L-asparaginase [Bacteroidales bacterium]